MRSPGTAGAAAGRAIVGLATFLTLGAVPVGATPTAPSRAFVVTEEVVAGRLRVFGRPGDLALRNRTCTAIVRKSDGWLVDFWRTDDAPPTAPQLKTLTAIDGLWSVNPIVTDARGTHDVRATRTELDGDSIRAVAEISLGAGVLEMIQSYRLAGDDPRLVVTTQFVHKSGGRVSGIGLGDEVRWGNVDYFVDGFGRVGPKFSGQARWVGRRGAGGDLKLLTSAPTPMRLDFKGKFLGLQPSILAAYDRVSVDPGQTATVQRVLAWETIDEKAPPSRTATVTVRLTDEVGRPIAAKLSFRGLEGTSDPNFGNDGDETGVSRFVWSGNGRFERTLRPGKYEILGTAGIERDLARFVVKLGDGEQRELQGSLPRVVETPGWISADLHLHQAASVDADIACSTRVVSVAAEGVELAAATDHYVVTDYAPSVAALLESGALARPILTVAGTEVSTVGHRFGHFNLFPMPLDEEVEYADTTPRALFADMRRASPGGILQVNHPRWDKIGYFWRYKLDPKTGRVPPQFRDEYDASFDALEVFNGLDATSEPKIRLVIMDWLHLLGQGHRYTATGNSDSHKLAFHDPGVPRNMIHWGTSTTDDDDLAADPAAVMEAVKRGEVTVTTGPILDVDVLGVGPGGTVRGRGTRVPMRIRVRAAPWIDVREVEVLVGSNAARVRWIPIKERTSVVRLDTTFDLVVPGPTFVVVLAKGARDLPNVHLPRVRPFALANPIWIEP